jgi:hypothetical protein
MFYPLSNNEHIIKQYQILLKCLIESSFVIVFDSHRIENNIKVDVKEKILFIFLRNISPFILLILVTIFLQLAIIYNTL